MVGKKKVKKTVARKSVLVKKSKRTGVQKRVVRNRISPTWLFINVVLIAIIIYGFIHAFAIGTVDDGVYIILGAIVVKVILAVIRMLLRKNGK